MGSRAWLLSLFVLGCGDSGPTRFEGEYWSTVKCDEDVRSARGDAECSFLVLEVTPGGRLLVEGAEWTGEYGVERNEQRHSAAEGDWERVDDELRIHVGPGSPVVYEMDVTDLGDERFELLIEPEFPDEEPEWTEGAVWHRFGRERHDDYGSP